MNRTFFCTILVLTCVVSAKAGDMDEYYIGPRAGVDLLEKPKRTAAAVSRLSRLTPVVILRKQRSWCQIEVRTGGQSLTGWVPEGAIRKRYQVSHTEQKKQQALAGLQSLFRSPDTRQTAVLGVRGLEEEGESVKARAPDKTMVRWMEDLRISDAEVAAFIAEGDLNP